MIDFNKLTLDLLQDEDLIHYPNGHKYENPETKTTTLTNLLNNLYLNNLNEPTIELFAKLTKSIYVNMAFSGIIPIIPIDETNKLASLLVYKNDAVSYKLFSTDVGPIEKSKLDVDVSILADIDMVGKKIAAILDRKIINEIRSYDIETPLTFSMKYYDGNGYIKDYYSALPVMINRCANIVAMHSRRGVGNIAILSKKSCDILKNASIDGYSSPSIPTGNIGIHYVGILNSSVRIYCDCEASDDMPIMVLYNGHRTFLDSGIALVVKNLIVPEFDENNNMTCVNSEIKLVKIPEVNNSSKFSDYIKKINIEL